MTTMMRVLDHVAKRQRRRNNVRSGRGSSSRISFGIPWSSTPSPSVGSVALATVRPDHPKPHFIKGAGSSTAIQWYSTASSPSIYLKELSKYDDLSRKNETLGNELVSQSESKASYALPMLPTPISLSRAAATSSSATASASATTTLRRRLPLHHNKPRKASFVEDRVASQQLPFMERTLAHVLAQPSYETLQLGKNELRTLYLYWLSKPVRDLCHARNCPDKPSHSADRLLHWMMHQLDSALALDSYPSDTQTTSTSTTTKTTDTTHHRETKHAAATLNYVLKNSNVGESVNAGLCRLLSLLLQPLQGTKGALQDHGRRTEDTAVQNVASLLAATRVYHIMQRLHADTIHFPHLRPDTQSYQSILNLFGKRCKLLVLLGPPPRNEGVHSPRIRRGVRWSAPDTVTALGGWTTPKECIAAAVHVIQSIQDNIDDDDDEDTINGCSGIASSSSPLPRDQQNKNDRDRVHTSIKPALIHYSMLLSMMSYPAGMEGHCSNETSLAQEALEILQGLEADPTFDHRDLSLYNPVLLAFVQEAAYFHYRKRYDLQQRAQHQCEALWDHLKQTFVDDEVMSADPITYSIMMKLYRDIDQADKAQAILDTMEEAASQTVMYKDTPDSSGIGNSDGHPLSILEIPAPTSMHYNTVLNALAKSTRHDSGERAMMLLRRMEEQTTAKGIPLPSVVPRPDRISYTSTLDAVLRGPSVEDVIDRLAVVLLERFEANEESHRRPDAITYNVLFHTLFRRLRDHDSHTVKVIIAEKMENLLRRLKQNSRHFRAVAGSRVFRYYNDCLLGWAHTHAPFSGERALRLLREMEEDGASEKFPSARPNGTTYQAVLASICRTRTVSAVHDAIEILEKMEASNVPVTVTAVNSFLGLLLNCRFEGSTTEADDAFVEIIMNRLRALARDRDDGFTAGWVCEGIFTHLNKEINPEKRKIMARRFELLFRALVKEPQYFRLNEGHGMVVYYNKCLKAWAFARTHESTSHALRILREMEELANIQPTDIGVIESCRPNAKSYEYILTCLSRAPDPITVEAARTVFRKMDQDGAPVTLAVLNRFIRILVKSGVEGGFAEAELILRGVEENFIKGKDDLCANQSTYSILVDGYMRSPSGVRDATRILQHMRSLYETTKNTALLPSVAMYRDLMQRWSITLSEDAMERVDELFFQMTLLSQPTNADYSALQSAWAKSMHRDAPTRVEAILVRMQEEYETGRNLASRPTVKNFVHVISSWATSLQPGSAERADAILQHLEELCGSDDNGMYRDLKPTTMCYEAALLGWKNSDSPVAGERALAILDRMKQMECVTPSATINHDCYHNVILSLAKSSLANKAAKSHALLQEMQATYDEGQNRFTKPTQEIYRAVLSVCATCTEGSEEERAEAADVTMNVMLEYVQFAGLGARQEVFLQFLYSVFRTFPAGEARDEAVRSVFCSSLFPCPANIVDTPSIRDALEKTTSPTTFSDIVGRHNLTNPMLSRLLKSRLAIYSS